MRTASGVITTFDAPGAGSGSGQGTVGSVSINTGGVIAGYYADSTMVEHGFIRGANGGIVTFNAPGAGTGFIQGTAALSINAAGTVAGYYKDGSNAYHSYVRAPTGAITTFDVTGSGAEQGTVGVGINAAERSRDIIWTPTMSITVSCALAAVRLLRSMPRAQAGRTSALCRQSINAAGSITGAYIDANNIDHGFGQHDNRVRYLGRQHG